MELRELTFFVAITEELHVGRAAERLHIAREISKSSPLGSHPPQSPLDTHRSFGKVERLNRSLATEWAHAAVYDSSTED